MAFKDAEQDPLRIRCLTELGPDHRVELKETFTQVEAARFKSFIDEMYTQLAKPHKNQSGASVFIIANRTVVENIARCFARADLLDPVLAQGTRGYYIEPEELLTITVPTGLPTKDPHKREHSGTFVTYHRTDWDNIPKILKEDCIRPANYCPGRFLRHYTGDGYLDFLQFYIRADSTLNSVCVFERVVCDNAVCERVVRV